MPLSRRLSDIVARMLGIAALVAAATLPAATQVTRVRGPAALQGQEITFTSPQFVVQALWFKSNDETNWAWMGSDEVYAIFSDMDPLHYDRATSVYGNVDEGDLVNFKSSDTCVAPQEKCDRGMPQLNVRFAFWEQDPTLASAFCPGDFEGSHNRLNEGLCGHDDLIGRGSIIHSTDELTAMLPAVGDAREFTAIMSNAGKYRFRYKITRLPDAERSIVIHLPPLDPTSTPISLQLSIVTTDGAQRVQLNWTGANGSTVSIYRDGALLVNTANDGQDRDAAPAGTHQYRVCEAGSTTVCSATMSIAVP
jgi:hypothetical protein